MLPGCSTRPEIRVRLFCEDPRDAARHRDYPKILMCFLDAEKGRTSETKLSPQETPNSVET